MSADGNFATGSCKILKTLLVLYYLMKNNGR
jgi:hypothetical protein